MLYIDVYILKGGRINRSGLRSVRFVDVFQREFMLKIAQHRGNIHIVVSSDNQLVTFGIH